MINSTTLSTRTLRQILSTSTGTAASYLALEASIFDGMQLEDSSGNLTLE
jgi:hypothetical protein